MILGHLIVHSLYMWRRTFGVCGVALRTRTALFDESVLAGRKLGCECRGRGRC